MEQDFPDLFHDGAYMADRLHHITGPCLPFGPDHAGAFADPPGSLSQITAPADKEESGSSYLLM